MVSRTRQRHIVNQKCFNINAIQGCGPRAIVLLDVTILSRQLCWVWAFCLRSASFLSSFIPSCMYVWVLTRVRVLLSIHIRLIFCIVYFIHCTLYYDWTLLISLTTYARSEAFLAQLFRKKDAVLSSFYNKQLYKWLYLFLFSTYFVYTHTQCSLRQHLFSSISVCHLELQMTLIFGH